MIINDLLEYKDLVSKYCMNDCIALYQILHSFSELVYNKWSIDITKYPTIPSLSFAIFRAHYLENNTIPITSGQIYSWIKDYFTGGST